MKKLLLATITILLGLGASPTMANPETWYTYWALGVSDNTLPADFETVFDIYESRGGTRTGIALDMFGFYWPMQDQRSTVGFVIATAADGIEARGDSFQLSQYTYGISSMHFFGNEVGDGLFIRGDVGPARAAVQSDVAGDATSSWGLGVLGGVGYGWSISGETRILFSVDYSVRRIEGESYKSGRLSVGGLW